MTVNSARKSRSLGWYKLLTLLVAVSITAYLLQKRYEEAYEGAYPEVAPGIQAEFTFGPNAVEIRLEAEPTGRQIVVFAYDQQGRQVAIIKPVYEQTVTIRPGDLADYRISFNDETVDHYEVINKNGGIEKGHDFFQNITGAKASSRSFGVQQCLYPLCTRCLDVCPVIEDGVIRIPRMEDGRFHPVIYIGGCPRSGKCFAVCPMGVINKAE